MAGKSLDYIKPAEPSFLKKFKEQVGYKEGPTIDSKREAPKLDDVDDRPEQEDEKPVVVVLRDGDLTQEEADQLLAKETENKDKEEPTDGKIVFKKPVKRSSDQQKSSDHNTTSSKKKKKDSGKKKHAGKKVKNSSLLSFGDDDEEES